MRYLLVIIVLFFGCNQNSSIDDSIQFFNNGLLKWEETKNSGRWTRLYENGKIQWQGNYVKGLDGLFCTNFQCTREHFSSVRHPTSKRK